MSVDRAVCLIGNMGVEITKTSARLPAKGRVIAQRNFGVKSMRESRLGCAAMREEYAASEP